ARLGGRQRRDHLEMRTPIREPHHSAASAARALAECSVVGDHATLHDSIPGKGRSPGCRVLTETFPEYRFTQTAFECRPDPVGRTRVKTSFGVGHQLAKWWNVADEHREPGVERLKYRQAEALCQRRENSDRGARHDFSERLVGDLAR